MNRVRTIAGLGLIAFASASRLDAQGTVADLVLTNGHVLTVDSADHVAQAIAIRGDRILAVGTDAQIAALAGPGTRRIDLAGRTVTPGLLDAHDHFSEGALEKALVIDLSYPAVQSIADVAARVSARADSLSANAWIVGAGWDEGKLGERRMIVARDLDAVSHGRPVYLGNTTGHSAVANHAALALAGITRDTPDPPGGGIDRNPDGTPTGLLRETAMDLVARLVPGPMPADYDRAFAAMARAFNAEGMTGLKDPLVNDTTWDAYRRVLADSALTVRVFVLFDGGNSEADARRLIARHGAELQRTAWHSDRLIPGGVKLFADGSGGSRTAWMYAPWNRNVTDVDSGNVGYPRMPPDTLRRLIMLYHAAGLHLGVHAIGDRAIDWVVDSYDLALRDHPIIGLRHSIIHANIPTEHALSVMRELEQRYDAAYPEPSATFMWWIGDNYAGNFGARALRLDPFRTFAARAIPWANGSDFPVTPFPARYGIWSAIARRPLLERYGGDPFGRAESVDVHLALRAVTLWAARQMFLEDRIGSIEPGKLADLAVWDRDFYSVPTDSIKDARCLMTIFNGRVVFDALKP
jgi:predicted amidohydrolase YtcJ